MKDIDIKELSLKNLHVGLLKDMNRYQQVTKCLRVENNKKVIKDICFTEQWDDVEKEKIVSEEIKETLVHHGSLIGAFDKDKLVGFALLDGKTIGPKGDYIQLLHLHVSYDYRGEGIGKRLFESCAIKARDKGVKKLYISGHSAVETQAFYKSVGCQDATWLYDQQVELEPCDCQLEYIV